MAKPSEIAKGLDHANHLVESRASGFWFLMVLVSETAGGFEIRARYLQAHAMASNSVLLPLAFSDLEICFFSLEIQVYSSQCVLMTD